MVPPPPGGWRRHHRHIKRFGNADSESSTGGSVAVEGPDSSGIPEDSRRGGAIDRHVDVLFPDGYVTVTVTARSKNAQWSTAETTATLVVGTPGALPAAGELAVAPERPTDADSVEVTGRGFAPGTPVYVTVPGAERPVTAVADAGGAAAVTIGPLPAEEGVAVEMIGAAADGTDDPVLLRGTFDVTASAAWVLPAALAAGGAVLVAIAVVVIVVVVRRRRRTAAAPPTAG